MSTDLKPLRVALLQMSSSDEVETNLAWLVARVAELRDVDVAILPEMWSFLVPDARGSERLELAKRYGAAIHSAMAEASQKLGGWLIGGSTFVPSVEAPKVLNRSFVFCDGQEMGHYDKCHLFDNQLKGGFRESRTVSAGSMPRVVPTPFGRVGLSICYDLRFPAHYQWLSNQGATLMTCPSAFTWATGKEHWSLLVRARAVENQSFFFAVNQCGRSKAGVHCWGHSMAVDPWGRVLAEAGEEPETVVVECDLKEVGEVRQRMPVLEHRRSF